MKSDNGRDLTPEKRSAWNERIILYLEGRRRGMSRKRYKPAQIIDLLREAEVGMSQGQTVGEACRSLGISEQAS